MHSIKCTIVNWLIVHTHNDIQSGYYLKSTKHIQQNNYTLRLYLHVMYFDLLNNY